MKNIKKKIIDIAKKINIDLIGFTSIEDFEELRPILLERERKGCLSGFEERDIEKRISPNRVFPEAKSIISIGLSYHVPGDKPKGGDLHGRITKSSWGRDYHLVLEEKMKELMDRITQEIMPMGYRAFVDTGPLVDRRAAYRAGLGCYGKNGFLIHPDFGSWFFIGNILVDRDIEGDQPIQRDICGDCEKCIASCPAGAIEGPYRFNAQKCISYLTQKKGILTEKERKLIGNNIYGCDICQLVCPHNKSAKYTNNESFKPDALLSYPKLGDLLRMTNKEFKATFKKLAAGWRGKKILQRNAIIALGNSKDKRAIQLLEESLKDERWDIRFYAAWALKQHGKEGERILRHWMDKEVHPAVLEEIERLLCAPHCKN